MIRVTFLLRRRADLSREAFQAYWLKQHGPLVAQAAEAFDTLRYIQVHTLETKANVKLAEVRGGKMEAPYDGVAEMWWRDDEALNASTRTAAGREAGAAIVADEANFLDAANSSVYIGYEYPQVNPAETVRAQAGSGVTKLYFPLRSRLSDAEASAYWHRQHGPLIRSMAEASGIVRYMQVHRVQHPLEKIFRAGRGIESPPYLGHAEVWMKSDGVDAEAARAAGARAIEDERRFIDFERSGIWLAHEHVLVDRAL